MTSRQLFPDLDRERDFLDREVRENRIVEDDQAETAGAESSSSEEETRKIGALTASWVLEASAFAGAGALEAADIEAGAFEPDTFQPRPASMGVVLAVPPAHPLFDRAANGASVPDAAAAVPPAANAPGFSDVRLSVSASTKASTSASTSTPSSESEIAYISGIAGGKVAAVSYWTWNYDSKMTYSKTRSYAVKWGSTAISAKGTAGGNVTYWFDTASNWSPKEKDALASGLALWSAECNINFSLASSAASAQHTFYRGDDGSAYWDAERASTAKPGATQTSRFADGNASMISIDTSVPGFGPLGSFTSRGGYPYQTLVHEQGHMIGLGHGGAYNGDVNERTQQFSPYDSRLWTIMSYIQPEYSGSKYFKSYAVKNTNWRGNYCTTPMMLDIQAVQRIYGAPTSGPLVSGGQVFGFNCNIEGTVSRYFDFTVNVNPVVTIWDAGKKNTLDLSGFATDSVISLAPGTFSSCDGMINNLCVAKDTTIETAIGGSGNDTITGSTADNVLKGGLGADRMKGVAGNDTYYVDNAGDIVDETGGSGTDIVMSSVSYSFADVKRALGVIENLTLTGTEDLNGAGNSSANVITGNSGDNILEGMGGADTLNGGEGTDTASYAASKVAVNVSLMSRKFTGGDAQGDKLNSIENLTGSAKADTLEGDTGNNVLNGGEGIDTVTYASVTKAVTVSLAMQEAQDTDGAGMDTLLNIENLTGTAYGDELTGNSGANILTGGAGADTLTGGGGADTFAFNSKTDGLDTITDFVSGEDKIGVSAKGFAGGLKVKKAPEFVTAESLAAVKRTAKTGCFIYLTSGENEDTLYWDANGGTATDATAFLKLQSGGPLKATDFLVA